MTRLRVDLTEATESLACIAAQPREGKLPAGATITGTLVGPKCRYARTLPTEFRVRESAGAATVLVTEPCYWTAEMPFLYDLRLEVLLADRVIDRIEQTIGLRRLSVHGPHLFVDGKRFVFRAASCSSPSNIDWTGWRNARLAMCLTDPSRELCEVAGEQGVWIIADMTTSGAAMDAICCPAVAVVVVSQSELASIRRPSGGPLIGARSTEVGAAAMSKEADILVYNVNSIAEAKRELSGYPRPVFAVRSDEHYDSLSDSRAACEALQRDLAPELNLAGYIV